MTAKMMSNITVAAARDASIITVGSILPPSG